MSRHKLYTFALILSVVALPAVAADQPWPMLRSGSHAVGYRTYDITDSSRTVGPRVDWRGKERKGDNFRHVRISVWYPAVPASDGQPMRYGDYIEAAGFETPMDGKLLQGAEAYLAHSSFGGADIDRLRESLDDITTAFRDAPPQKGSFPLIVYAPSFSYEPFENTAMFEYLASQGYIIASSRSSGPETREMSYDRAGAEASVRDLELMIQALADFESVDLNQIGAAGFSWGGLTAAMLGMRNHNVRAVLALDGSFEHTELESAEENHDFLPARLRGGYMAIVGEREPTSSLLERALYTDVFEVRYPDLLHWDFSSDMIRIGVWSAGEPDPARRRLVDGAYGLIAYQARLLFDAYLKENPAHRDVLLGGDLRPKDDAVVIEHLSARAAFPAPPSTAEFAALLREDVPEARAVLSNARKSDPDIVLLDWMQMQDVITTSPFETKLAILELAHEELGESSIYFNNMGQAWRLEGNPEKALGYFRQALEHNPDSGFAKRSVTELEDEVGSES